MCARRKKRGKLGIKIKITLMSLYTIQVEAAMYNLKVAVVLSKYYLGIETN
jgi:hypothetical protein